VSCDREVCFFKIKAGTINHYRYTIDTEINLYVSIRSSCCTDTDDGDRRKKQRLFRNQIYYLTFTHISKKLKGIEFNHNFVELILCELNYGTHYTGDHLALALLFVAFTV